MDRGPNKVVVIYRVVWYLTCALYYIIVFIIELSLRSQSQATCDEQIQVEAINKRDSVALYDMIVVIGLCSVLYCSEHHRIEDVALSLLSVCLVPVISKRIISSDILQSNAQSPATSDQNDLINLTEGDGINNGIT